MNHLFARRDAPTPETTTRTRTRRRTLASIATVAGASLSATAATAPTANGTLPGFLHTDGSKIKTASGETYTIKAASWFGLETYNCMPHGLWTLNLDATVKQIKSFGFNTIRLPYANQCLTTAKPESLNEYANPTLAGKTPIQIMDAVIASAKSNGLNIILDRHRPDYNAQSELWYTGAYPETRWISDWTMLANRYKNDTNVIGFDLHNEPYGAATWGSGNVKTDWKLAAEKAGNAIQAVNPKALIIVEGIEAQSGDDWTWWGGGLKDARNKLVNLNVKNQVVYSPHDYPASVYNQKWFSDPSYPKNLTALWDKNWGYLAKENIAPVWVGEFGTSYKTDSDKKWLDSLASYMKANGISWSFWSYNPNSGDTGGLVGTDWRTPETAKLTALAPLFAVPDFAAGSTVTPPATTTPTTPPATTTPTTPPATTAPTTPPTTTPTTPPTTPPTTTPTTPPTTIPTTPPTAPPVVGETGTTAKLRITSSWNGGYVANVDVTTVKAVKGWTVSWTDANATKVVNAWGMKCTLAAKTVTCTGFDYATALAAGQTRTIGLQIDAKVPPAAQDIKVTVVK